MRSTLPRWAVAADILSAILLVLAFIGLYVEVPALWIGDVRLLSVRSPLRLVGWVAIVMAVRHWRVPTPPAYAPLLRGSWPTGERRPGASRVWSFRELAAITAGMTGLVVLSTWPLVAQLDSVSDLGDPLFSIWRLAWVSHQLPRNPLGLFDANIFHPERLTATYSDATIVPGLLSAPLMWTGVHPVTVFNLLVLASAVLAGLATSVLVRDLTGSRGAALIAGALFAVHPHRMDNLPQIELQMSMWIPMVLWAVHRTFATGAIGYGVLAGILFALQALSSLYYGVFLAVCLVPLVAALWLGRRSLRPLGALAAGTAVATALVAPVAAAYVSNQSMLGERDIGVVRSYSAELGDFLTPNDRSLLYGAWAAGGQPERHLFPRLTPVVLAAVALWPPLTPTRVAYALLAAVAVNGSLGVHGTLYPWLYEYLPPVRGLRVPARLNVLTGLALIVLAGFGAARLLARWPRVGRAMTVGTLAFIAVEALPRLSFVHVWTAPPAIYQAITDEDAVLAEYPMSSEEYGLWFDVRYLYFSVFHWHKMVNGYSGFFPRSHADLVAHQRSFPDDDAIAYLRRRQVTHVTVHGAFCPDGCAKSIAALNARRDVELVTAAPWEGGVSHLYRLR